MRRYSRITGTGSYLPPRRLTNADLVAELGQRGIEQRRLRQRHPEIDPLPGLNDGHCLLRRAQLGLIFALQTQFDFLPST